MKLQGKKSSRIKDIVIYSFVQNKIPTVRRKTF